MDNQVLLDIQDLRVSFKLDEGSVQAVDGVSLSIRRGEVLGIVGESGCGKSVTAQSILRIVPPPGNIDSGHIFFYPPGKVSAGQGRARNGRAGQDKGGQRAIDLASLPASGTEIRRVRGKDIGMIFQEPMSSFSPVHTIGSQIMEAIQLHQDVTTKEARRMAAELLKTVGIPNAEQRIDAYPHQFSGGMRQRAMIAVALSCRPSLLIADEPTTALDVTIQAQILNLMRDLRHQFGMAVMFITHNLGVIAQIADTVAIMYMGRVVEYGPVREILHNPKHPYTANLLQAVPRLGKTARQRLVAIEGSVPSPYQRLPGCAFQPRCASAIAGRCEVHMPALTQLDESHTVRCFLYEPE